MLEGSGLPLWLKERETRTLGSCAASMESHRGEAMMLQALFLDRNATKLARLWPSKIICIL